MISFIIIILFTRNDLKTGQQEILDINKMKDYRLLIIFIEYKIISNIYDEYNLSKDQVLYFEDNSTMQDVFDLLLE